MQETKFLLFFFKSSFFILCLNNVFFLNVNKTPLHIATFDDNFDAVKALCESNEIDLNAQDNEGIFHFFYLISLQFIMLQRKASLTLSNFLHLKRIAIRIKYQNMEFHFNIFSHFTPIFNAAIYNHFDIVRYLCKSSGFDPNYKRESVLLSFEFIQVFLIVIFF